VKEIENLVIEHVKYPLEITTHPVEIATHLVAIDQAFERFG